MMSCKPDLDDEAFLLLVATVLRSNLLPVLRKSLSGLPTVYVYYKWEDVRLFISFAWICSSTLPVRLRQLLGT